MYLSKNDSERFGGFGKEICTLHILLCISEGGITIVSRYSRVLVWEGDLHPAHTALHI